ncbi:MAG TPA: hypothetical protein VFJ61_07545 [Solirubrobacterales bacterium]|nr:hypothetical protein [Solirubrobacterales bacterium]
MRRVNLVLIVLAFAGLAAVVAAGCGSSADSQERTLTKKQFVHVTEAFCEREYKPEERDMEKYADEHGLLFGGGEPWEEEILTQAVVFDYIRDKINFFKSLPPPEGDEKEVRGMIEAFESGLERSENNPAGLAEERPWTKKKPPEDFWDASYETTTDYGPWLCGQP